MVYAQFSENLIIKFTEIFIITITITKKIEIGMVRTAHCIYLILLILQDKMSISPSFMYAIVHLPSTTLFTHTVIPGSPQRFTISNRFGSGGGTVDPRFNLSIQNRCIQHSWRRLIIREFNHRMTVDCGQLWTFRDYDFLSFEPTQDMISIISEFETDDSPFDPNLLLEALIPRELADHSELSDMWMRDFLGMNLILQGLLIQVPIDVSAFDLRFRICDPTRYAGIMTQRLVISDSSRFDSRFHIQNPNSVHFFANFDIQTMRTELLRRICIQNPHAIDSSQVLI